MGTRIRHAWEVMTTGYWFVPVLMMIGATALALVMLYLDRVDIGRRAGATDWLYGGGADGAKTLLSTVAASVITVAGVVFSITIAALTQAASQFGPRLLRNFMRDTGNQFVLGTFVATFLYCLLILRTIHGEMEGDGAFVPHASVTVAVLLAVASIAVLIYFIHHVSVSLQAPAVVAAVRDDLERVIARLPDENKGTLPAAREDDGLPTALAGEGNDDVHHDDDDNNGDGARAVASTSEGYVQVIDYESLVELAEEADLVLRLDYRPGDYVIERSRLLRAWPAGRCDDALAARVNEAFICGRNATPEQDVGHAFRQIVEVAVRALSPGVNDPFTAINCVDALGSAVCRVARRGLPGPLHHGRGGKLRMLAPAETFAGVADTAFNQLRQHARRDVAVTIRLLETLEACARHLKTEDQKRALRRHADMIYRQSEEAIDEPQDRADVRRRWEAAALALGGGAPAVAAEPEPAR